MSQTCLTGNMIGGGLCQFLKMVLDDTPENEWSDWLRKKAKEINYKRDV